MWLFGNACRFLRQILFACLAEFCPLTCCFCLKLLYVYAIGITPNLTTHCYLLWNVTFWTIIAKFTEKVEAELSKTDMLTYSCVSTVTGSATKLKTGRGGGSGLQLHQSWASLPIRAHQYVYVSIYVSKYPHHQWVDSNVTFKHIGLRCFLTLPCATSDFPRLRGSESAKWQTLCALQIFILFNFLYY